MNSVGLTASSGLTTLDRDILNEADFFVSFLSRNGFQVKPHSQKALEDLVLLSFDKKQEILRYLKTTNYFGLLSQDPDSIPESPSEHPEKALVEKAIDFYKLKLENKEFWNEVGQNDIIEIYDENGYQIFRTFNFFNMCGYSLMDLLTHEWYVLWERPKFVVNGMFERGQRVLSGQQKGIESMNLPPHIVKEVYNGTDAQDFVPRSHVVKFGHICPLYRDENPAGILLNSSVHFHTLGETETKNVLIL